MRIKQALLIFLFISLGVSHILLFLVPVFTYLVPMNYSIPIIGTNRTAIQLENNPDAHNPTIQELSDFMIGDDTDQLEYIPVEFDCVEFAQIFHNNAERAGIKCAVVQINIPTWYGHYICAVRTTNAGMWFVEPQRNFIMDEETFSKFTDDYLGFRTYAYCMFW